MSNAARLILAAIIVLITHITTNKNLVQNIVALDDGSTVIVYQGTTLLESIKENDWPFRYIRLVGNGIVMVSPSEEWFVLELNNMAIRTKDATVVVTTDNNHIQHIRVKSGSVNVDYKKADGTPLVNT